MTNYAEAVRRNDWEKHGERPSILDFGAKGNGSYAYEHEAINRALSATAKGDLDIEVPAGIYLINSPIIHRGRRSLSARGSIFPRFGAYDPANVYLSLGCVLKAGPDFPADDYTPLIDARGCNNIGLTGVEVVGNGTSTGIALGSWAWTPGTYPMFPSVSFSDGAITEGTAIFESLASNFTDANVRQPISIAGAGLSGATLYAYITERVSAHVVTISEFASTTVTGATGQYAYIGNGFQTNGKFRHCSFTNHKVGAGVLQFNYCEWTGNNFGNNSDFGLFAQIAGNSDYKNNHFNYTSRDVVDADRFTHIGLYLGISTGDSKIVGGSIEQNKIGLMVRSYGVVAHGVFFDANAGAHWEVSNPGDATCGLTLSGCTFGSGGWQDIQFPGSWGWLETIKQVSPPSYGGVLASPTSVVLEGNSVYVADKETAFPYAQAVWNSTPGPQHLIYAYGGGIVRAVIKGNQFDRASTGLSIAFDPTHHSRSYIELGGNSGHLTFSSPPLVFTRVGNTRIMPLETLANPTEGQWQIGDRILNTGYEQYGQTAELVCTRAGSLHPDTDLSAITAAITAASYTVTFTGEIRHQLADGDVIAIAGDGVTYHTIIHIDYGAGTALLSSAAINTVSGAAVTFSAPEFKPQGQISHRTVSGSPYATTPNMTGERILRTDTQTWYKATGTTAADWRPSNGDNVTADYHYTGDVTLGRQHGYVSVDVDAGNTIVTIPEASGMPGKVYIIRRVTAGANTLTVTSAGGNIKPAGVLGNASTSLSMARQGDVLAVVSDGADWNAFAYPNPAFTVFANGDLSLLHDLYVLATTSRPAKIASDGKLTSGTISVTNANDVDVSGLTDGSLVKRSGTALASVSAFTANRVLISNGSGAIDVLSALSASAPMVTAGDGLPSTSSWSNVYTNIKTDIDGDFVSNTDIATYYYSKSEIDTILAGYATTGALATKSNAGHNHDYSGTDSGGDTYSGTTGSD